MNSGLLHYLKRLFSSEITAETALPPQAAGLRLPAGVEHLQINKTDVLSSYLPLGFVTFEAHQLGNGDYFGFYWPVGRENSEPLIAETQHDGGRLEPGFSGLKAFLGKTEGIDSHDWIELPTFEEDPDSARNCYGKARELIAEKAFDPAVAQLEKAVAALPEYTEALAALAGQYLRMQRTDEACRLAVQMIISPPSFGFGGPVDNIARWFSRLDTGPADLTEDPIWKGRAKLASIPTGGTKDSQAYPVLREAMDVYAEQGEFVKALTLMQTYSDFMNSETRSFQERQGYDFATHRLRQRDLSQKLPNGPRYLI
ncbi:tetratricopeptide repeat protein [Mesorhizobium sp. UC22_110]|uniref:tetratricopeptide repeat protein n=1 Tax=unclassified Mesorhizobium TaxID=325217 RepID=UPI00366C2368